MSCRSGTDIYRCMGTACFICSGRRQHRPATGRTSHGLCSFGGES
jgi:hypothetical protein